MANVLPAAEAVGNHALWFREDVAPLYGMRRSVLMPLPVTAIIASAPLPYPTTSGGGVGGAWSAAPVALSMACTWPWPLTRGRPFKATVAAATVTWPRRQTSGDAVPDDGPSSSEQEREAVDGHFSGPAVSLPPPPLRCGSQGPLHAPCGSLCWLHTPDAATGGADPEPPAISHRQGSRPAGRPLLLALGQGAACVVEMPPCQRVAANLPATNSAAAQQRPRPLVLWSGAAAAQALGDVAWIGGTDGVRCYHREALVGEAMVAAAAGDKPWTDPSPPRRRGRQCRSALSGNSAASLLLQSVGTLPSVGSLPSVGLLPPSPAASVRGEERSREDVAGSSPATVERKPIRSPPPRVRRQPIAALPLWYGQKERPGGAVAVAAVEASGGALCVSVHSAHVFGTETGDAAVSLACGQCGGAIADGGGSGDGSLGFLGGALAINDARMPVEGAWTPQAHVASTHSAACLDEFTVACATASGGLRIFDLRVLGPQGPCAVHRPGHPFRHVVAAGCHRASPLVAASSGAQVAMWPLGGLRVAGTEPYFVHSGHLGEVVSVAVLDGGALGTGAGIDEPVWCSSALDCSVQFWQPIPI